METKKCGTCKQEKPIAEFYKHKRDGYQSVCKDCNKEYNKLYKRRPERQAYNRQIAEKLRSQGYFKAYNEVYYQKPEVKKRRAENMRRYTQDPRLRIRFLARWYAKRMTNNGTIKQQSCALCGNEKSQRHHSDYNKPLLIVWLCVDCHRKLHAKVEGK